ncbi:MAG TPA: ATP-binding protein, partial [Bacteroidia bacterium]|nr:ATP-binding protein [Bacteroidia bacterium]
GKAILIDATGEFESFADKPEVESVEFNVNTFFHYSNLKVTDLFVLFRPSEQVQLPKLQEAIKSLKLVKVINTKGTALSKAEQTIKNYIDDNNQLIKERKPRVDFLTAIKENPEVENLNGDFDIENLAFQVYRECVYNPDFTVSTNYGGVNDRDNGSCQSLITRILFVTKTDYFGKIFGMDGSNTDATEFSNKLTAFLVSDKKRLLRISLAKVPFENNVREILVNAIGRLLLDKARTENFLETPVLTFIDEAHQFLNKRIKGEFAFEVELNAFDQIAKECRKYGLFLVLSTQMPRDIPTGTLSQVGTFIVHRLINPHDKEAIENASSASSKNALAFLPILSEGEALLMGVDFPMPIILKVTLPKIEPKYKTPTIFKRK